MNRPIQQANFFEKESTDGWDHKRLFELIVTTLKAKTKRLLCLSIYQNPLLSLFPFWIIDIGHRMGERNAHCDPAPRDGKKVTSERCKQASENDEVKTKITVLPYPPYSPDLASCDFRIFPKLARRFQFHRFQSADEIKDASQAELKNMIKKGYQKCFDDLDKRQKSVLLLKDLISKENVFQQFNWFCL
ncbi:hypothetical protein TNCV_4794741 [Trichonephila clavipes]|nr:hypothetical protein TNCV_4794741 [Trichonephila clavipes]